MFEKYLFYFNNNVDIENISKPRFLRLYSFTVAYRPFRNNANEYKEFS